MKNLFLLKLVSAILVLLFSSNSFSQLNGNYTIGVGGNYTTLNAAVSSLVSNGISGAVIFNIKNGNYNEVVTLDSVRGVNVINTVTFQSQSGNDSNVILYSTSTNSNFLIKINRADFIKFQNITFIDSLVMSGSKIIELTNNSDNINFTSNTFISNQPAFFSSISIIHSSNPGKYLIFRDNTFIGYGGSFNAARQGIIFDGTSNSYGTVISNNSFNGLTNTIKINHMDSLLIEKNLINCIGGLNNDNRGIFLDFCKEIKILKNNIIAGYNCGPSSIYGSSLALLNCSNSLIANNFFKFHGCEAVGFSESSVNIKFFYNTIVNDGGDFPQNLGIANSNSISLMNNIYGNFNSNFSRPGVIYNFGNSLVSSNYNAFSYYAQNIATYNGVNIPDLPAWKITTGNDYKSVFRPIIYFVSSNDLHLTGYSLTDDSLKGIPLTEVTDDYDGNPRDPLRPTMGADEPFYAINITVDLKLFIEGFYNNISNTQVADTLKAYLRSASSPNSIIDSAIANIQSNGIGRLRFYNAPSGNYYIEVNHRNSIETWSKTGGESLTPGNTVSYDFTNSISQAFGNNLKLKGSKYCIYSGDVNQDGVIDISDNSLIDNDAFNFVSGYVSSDLNGDNFIDLEDYSIADNNAFNFVSVIRP